MNTYKNKFKIAIIFLFSIWAWVGFGFAEGIVLANFGSEQPAKTDFGAATKPAAIDEWIAGSVRQVDGVLKIKSSGASATGGIQTLNADDFGGEDGFLWQAMEALTKDGGQMTKEQISQLASAIVEKYLLNIDSWPNVVSKLQSWGITDEKELESLRTIFEKTNILIRDMDRMIDFGVVFKDSKGDEIKFPEASDDATVIVGKYNKDSGEFETVGSYYDGRLLNPDGQRAYIGTTTGKSPVYIMGDEQGLNNFDAAVELINDPLKNQIINKKYVNSEGLVDLIMGGGIYNCRNFSKDTQKLLLDNGIEAYGVVTTGDYGHMAVAIKVGDVKYLNGYTYPTFAVIEPQTGHVMGQLGGPGTKLTNAYNSFYMPGAIENAMVVKDFELVDERDYGSLKLDASLSIDTRKRVSVDVSETEIYTYTNSENIDVSKDGYMRVGNIIGGPIIKK